MERLTPQLLVSLCKHRTEPSLSLFAPSSLTWPEIAQNQTRWENLLRQAAISLTARGMNEEDAGSFLQPIVRMATEKELSENSSGTKAFFHSRTLTTSVHLPSAQCEQAVVASHFYVLPLVKLLAEKGLFYVLTLSKNEVRLFEGWRDHLAEHPLPGLPTDLATSLDFDPRQPNLQSHGGVAHGKAGRSTVIHGQGGATDWSKEELKAYFQKIDEALQPVLSSSKAPLVLACVDYYEPIYREINSYPFLLREHVTGSPDRFSDRYLLEQSWKLVSPHFERADDLALRHCYELSDTKRFSTDLDKIILAARSGQVETLFLAENVARWGIYDTVADCVKVFDEKIPESEDLLNLAAIETICTGGSVVLVPAEDLPQRREIAAVFRYEPVDIEYVARMDHP